MVPTGSVLSARDGRSSSAYRATKVTLPRRQRRPKTAPGIQLDSGTAAGYW